MSILYQQDFLIRNLLNTKLCPRHVTCCWHCKLRCKVYCRIYIILDTLHIWCNFWFYLNFNLWKLLCALIWIWPLCVANTHGKNIPMSKFCINQFFLMHTQYLKLLINVVNIEKIPFEILRYGLKDMALIL